MERTPEKKVLNVGDCDGIACKNSGEWFGHKILAYFVDGNDRVGCQLNGGNLSDYRKPEEIVSDRPRSKMAVPERDMLFG